MSSAETARSAPSGWVAAGVAALGALIVGGWTVGLPEGASMRAYALFVGLLTVPWLGAAALLWRRDGRVVTGIVLTFALLARLGAWAWPPTLSSDLYRYAWDGRVQLSGHSPYAAPPGDAALEALRDGLIYPHINRKEAVTVYPPGAQLLFAGLAAAHLRTMEALKAAALVAELFGIGLLMGALRRRGLPSGRLVLYAWSPLVVSEVGVSGHLDAFVWPLLLWALLLSERRRAGAAGLVLGFATLMKLYPVLLFAALPHVQRRRALVAALLLATSLYGAYLLWSGPAVLGFLPNYVRSAEDFNIGVRRLFELALSPLGRAARPAAMAICVAVLGALAWRRWRLEDAERNAFRDAAALALAFVLWIPTAMHPWYVLWIVPFVCLSPSPAALWLVAALPLSYLKYGPPDGPMPGWVSATIWIPAFAACMLPAVVSKTPNRQVS